MPNPDRTPTPPADGHVCSTAELAALVQKSCPYRIPGHTRAGCCRWNDFLPGFADSWPRWFGAPPSSQQWSEARADWKAGNTGWEAAHNAQRRVKDRSMKHEHDAWASAGAVLTRASRG
jgi:hypothetical protein